MSHPKKRLIDETVQKVESFAAFATHRILSLEDECARLSTENARLLEISNASIFVPEREHVTSGVPCWCNPDTSEEGLVIHRGGN